jgi:hypothetical protein
MKSERNPWRWYLKRGAVMVTELLKRLFLSVVGEMYFIRWISAPWNDELKLPHVPTKVLPVTKIANFLFLLNVLLSYNHCV